MISYRKMTESELPRLGDIDRSEIIRVGFEARDGMLIKKDVTWDTPTFMAEGEGEHTVAEQIAFCRGHLARKALLMGAFEGETLVGIGVLTPDIRPGMAQLAYLQVSAAYRRMGIASAITRHLLQHARDQGAVRVYVSATPSESAVCFYTSFGFDLTLDPLPELYELEPEDIHMLLALDAGQKTIST